MATGRTPAPKPIDDFEGWLAAFLQPTVIVEVLVLAVCVALAWGVVVVVRRSLVALTQKAIARAGARDFEGERAAMRFIRDEHTYINRVDALKAGFRCHWRRLGLTHLALQ